MNRQRRVAIKKLQDRLEEIKQDLEILQEEEQEYIDGIPENLQTGERYDRAEEIMDAIDTAMESLEEAMDNLESATE